MSTYRKHNSIVTAALAAAALALGSARFPQPPTRRIHPAPTRVRRGSDADVAARVKGALHPNPTLDSRHIDVAVEHGEVHLKGFVQDNRTLLAANQVATKAAGDRKIINELIIKQNFANAP